MRRLLWLSWTVLAVILAIVWPLLRIHRPLSIPRWPLENFTPILLNLVTWLVILVVPVFILWLISLYRSDMLFRKGVKSLGI